MKILDKSWAGISTSKTTETFRIEFRERSLDEFLYNNVRHIFTLFGYYGTNNIKRKKYISSKKHLIPIVTMNFVTSKAVELLNNIRIKLSILQAYKKFPLH